MSDVRFSRYRVENRIELARWLCKQHNTVNDKLGKDQFPCDMRSLDKCASAVFCGSHQLVENFRLKDCQELVRAFTRRRWRDGGPACNEAGNSLNTADDAAA